MYIKKLIIDGFKSYGKRTEIDGFDKEFTAITGLNGTGKSNILDSICFVLGITNLSQVKRSRRDISPLLSFCDILPSNRLARKSVWQKKCSKENSFG